MPENDLRIYSYRYFDFASYMQSSLVLFPTLNEAASIVVDGSGRPVNSGDVTVVITT